MNRRLIAPLITAVVVVTTCAGPAWAGPAPRVIQRLTDPATRAIIEVARQSSGAVTVTTTGGGVTVVRQMTPDRLVTTIREGARQVTLTQIAGKSVVRLDAWTITVGNHDHVAAQAAGRAVSASPVVRDAIDLLGRLRLPATQPVTSMLQFTRAFLVGATGDAEGAMALVEATRMELANHAAVVRTAYMLESSCWQDYEKEAIAAANDFASCMKDIPWYDFWDPESCKAIYDMQAIGAFSEWAHCVSLWEVR